MKQRDPITIHILSEQQRIGLEVASLALAGPAKTHTENHDRVWKAFELGREYQKVEKDEKRS